MTVEELNRMPVDEARQALARCCGARAWVEGMCDSRPFGGRDALFVAAALVWGDLGPAEWREAFAHHPRIGDIESLRKRFASTAGWASAEQGAVAAASDATLAALAEGNRAYEEKFGYIFIVCATGKSADEMLALLKARLPNHPERELGIAAEEQMKITRIRLEKLMGDTP